MQQVNIKLFLIMALFSVTMAMAQKDKKTSFNYIGYADKRIGKYDAKEVGYIKPLFDKAKGLNKRVLPEANILFDEIFVNFKHKINSEKDSLFMIHKCIEFMEEKEYFKLLKKLEDLYELQDIINEIKPQKE